MPQSKSADFFRQPLAEMVDPHRPAALAGRLARTQIERGFAPHVARQVREDRTIAQYNLYGTLDARRRRWYGRCRAPPPFHLPDGQPAVPKLHGQAQRRGTGGALGRADGLAALQWHCVLRATSALRCHVGQTLSLSYWRGRRGRVAPGPHRHGCLQQHRRASRVRAADRGQQGAGEDPCPPGGLAPTGDRARQGGGRSHVRGHRLEANLCTGRQEPAPKCGRPRLRQAVQSAAQGRQRPAHDPEKRAARCAAQDRTGQTGHGADADQVANANAARRAHPHSVAEGQEQTVGSARAPSGVHQQKQRSHTLRVRREGQRRQHAQGRPSDGHELHVGQSLRWPHAGGHTAVSGYPHRHGQVTGHGHHRQGLLWRGVRRCAHLTSGTAHKDEQQVGAKSTQACTSRCTARGVCGAGHNLHLMLAVLRLYRAWVGLLMRVVAAALFAPFTQPSVGQRFRTVFFKGA